MNTSADHRAVPLCLRDADGCLVFLACGHYWKRCGGGCPGWGGIDLAPTPEEEARTARLIAAGLMSTHTTRTAASAQALGGAA